jgi:hypothetical protein
VNWTGEGEPEELLGARVSAVLRCPDRALLGRTFAPGKRSERPSPLLSHGLWQDVSGSRDVLGKTHSRWEPFAVIGVMPEAVYPPGLRQRAAFPSFPSTSKSGSRWRSRRSEEEPREPRLRGDRASRPGSTLETARRDGHDRPRARDRSPRKRRRSGRRRPLPRRSNGKRSTGTPGPMGRGRPRAPHRLRQHREPSSRPIGRSPGRSPSEPRSRQPARVLRQFLCESTLLAVTGGLSGSGSPTWG